MVSLRKSLLDTLMQIFIMLWHLVAEISRFKFDDYRVIRTGASDLKLFWGGVFVANAKYRLIQIYVLISASVKTLYMFSAV